jgi:hypothetical protein
MMKVFKKVAHTFVIIFGFVLCNSNGIQGQEWPKIYGDNVDALISDLSESYDNGYILTTFTYNNQGASEYG